MAGTDQRVSERHAPAPRGHVSERFRNKQLTSRSYDRHTFESSIKFKVHHGKDRLESIHGHEHIDIVLTTYHTVSAEWKWKNKQDPNHSVLFSGHWRRIVLDEGTFQLPMRVQVRASDRDFKPISYAMSIHKCHEPFVNWTVEPDGR